MVKGVWPEGHAHSLQPALASMEELLPCPLGEVPDGLLSNAILEVGIDPAEGKLLLLCLSCCAKFVVRKAAIVAMVVLDLHAVLGGEAFKCALGIKGLQRDKIDRHQIDKLETQVVVNKDGHILVASLSEGTLRLAIEIWLS